MLLKYLGETGPLSRLSAAAAVCVPLDLHKCAEALKMGFSKVYQRHLIKRMKQAVARKFDPHTAAFNWDRAIRKLTETLDVYPQEPISEKNPFLKLDNVVLSPHLAGASRDIPKHHSRMMVDDLLLALSGKKPTRLANPEVWEKSRFV